MQQFSAISELLGGDDARIRRVLCAFRDEMDEDIRLIDNAILRKNWKLIGVVVLRAATACHLMGEMRAGIRLETLADAGARTTEDPVLNQYAVCARDLLADLMTRISECVDGVSCVRTSGDAQT